MSNTPHMWRDRAWKEVLSEGARSAIEYFMPDLAADIDPVREISGIPGMELFPEGSDSGKHKWVTDVFFDVPMLDGENGNVALFAEQQREKDEELALRVFETYMRLQEKRGVRTTAFVIYTGGSPDVNAYTELCYGSAVSFKFRTFHVPSRDLEELRKDKRPFGLVVLASRLSLEAGNDTKLREKYAWEMLKTINEGGYGQETRLFTLDFSRRIFRLSDLQMDNKVKEAYEMQTIPLREYAQQVKLEIAKDEGREEGKNEGKFEVARSMLADGLSIEIIERYTGFCEKEILALR